MAKETKKRQIRRKKAVVLKPCYFCESKKDPWYGDTEVIGRYLTDRAKIIGRSRSGICAKHQRRLSLAIKYARHLALLPFVARI